MKNKKWGLLMLMAFLVSFFCFARGAQSDSQGTVPVSGPVADWGAAMKSKYNGTRITALLAAHPSSSAVMEMISEFTSLTGIRVDTRVLASTEMKTMQRSNSSTKAGTFDVYMIDAFTIYEYAKAGYIENLTGRLKDPVMTPSWYDYEDILLAYRDGVSSVDGDAYSLPIAGESRFFAYRTDLFEKYGRQIPKTLDELLETAAFFNGREPGLYGVSFRGAPGTMAGSAHMALAYCFTDSPIINQKTGQYTVNSPATIQSIEYFLKFAKAGPPDIASYTHEDGMALFAQGKCAMWFDATALASTVETSAIPVVANNTSYFSVPNGPAGGSGAIAGWGLGIPSDSRYKDAAYAFIMFMSSREKSKEYNLKGGVPSRTSAFQDPEILGQYATNKYIYEAINAAGDLSRRGITYNYPSIHVLNFMAIIGNSINRAMIGQITAAEAANNAQREIESVLAE
jgi:multiple sugar transport system substrate-binding protein/sorbitol/mannitol transport system substrate-binding protein